MSPGQGWGPFSFSQFLPHFISGSFSLPPSPLSCSLGIYHMCQMCVKCFTICATHVFCKAAKKTGKGFWSEGNKSHDWQTKNPHRHSGNSLLTLILSLSTELSKHAMERHSEHEAPLLRAKCVFQPTCLTNSFPLPQI